MRTGPKIRGVWSEKKNEVLVHAFLLGMAMGREGYLKTLTRHVLRTGRGDPLFRESRMGNPSGNIYIFSQYVDVDLNKKTTALTLLQICKTGQDPRLSYLAISFGLSQSIKDKPFFTSLKTLCEMTLYPKTCYDALSPLIHEPNNNYDSQFLYNISVQVSIDEITRVSNNFSENGKLTQTLIKHTKEKLLLSAIESCRDFLSLALYNLNSSLPTSSSALTTHETRTNFRTWLSAAGADLQTCMNGFEYAPDEARKVVAANLDNSTKLVTISLAIISKIDDYMCSHEEITSIVDIIDTSSELNSDNWEPTWLSYEDRKLLKSSKQMMNPNVVVAADGSGNYKTITEAINVVPPNSNNRFVIYVKNGVYNENVKIDVEKWNVLIYGDGMGNTIVSSNLSNGTGTTTASSGTFIVYGKGFIAMDIGFQNTAGAANGQAVALLSASDQSVFYRCLIDGYQDTLCTQSNRQFYRECKIYGTVDFIFGDAAVVIQNCDILAKKPIPGQSNTITAQGKSIPNANTGISIQKCSIRDAEDLGGAKTFLGRPWFPYSTVVVMESQLGSLIDPQGWLPWGNNVTAPDTIFYVEYNNVGPGASTANRVAWKGLRVNNTQNDAGRFTVRSFINGDQWLPSTGVPFQADL
ncbi:hypothetical protein DH2020_020470 [Rehmannia glutinosa]|uniref:Pectinesterase n=1 Tax=Rehmannia glutinosa TaxID=99300 RepID=A0ABR0WG72_REHGL